MTERSNGQPAWAYQMELKLLREIQAVKDSVPSEGEIRSIVRQEIDHTSEVARESYRMVWGVRSTLVSLGMFLIAVSTFFITILRGAGHG